ncbi:hypothetical protein DSM106972_026300 [Dulcicalothrix desertica PCC 7102]|uniref:Sucrase ferredoxin n=1 Tax=Dulcicalothrix desertica PCC 7102 TaxID=232991 RepID=A0A3S1CS16_9CYAN|nr:sucrase ferredoxin [Dulcicalothrix desertica]RUT07369.1 hypothetical protein DSM106972_026300 [Dulcicalothrix desertica PCC 7102]TWH55437.1 hypothetical protein CAL7102_03574 [Dulcicalothrix desertica PCC 7102]
MTNFFCAQESRQVREDPIGNAEVYQIYVLIEYPTPWARNAFDSKCVPDNLKALWNDISFKWNEEYIVFLLVYNQELQKSDSSRVIIFYQGSGLTKGYKKLELQIPNINDVAPTLQKYLFDENLEKYVQESQTRDILICTHGSRDKCCAKYGNIFYRQAKAIIANSSLNHVRIWQVSHFGGHRFAPTAIDFPDGRYYARLDSDSFNCILTRTGNIEKMNYIYRGWGILPGAVQVLEREMMMRYGWEWFNYKAEFQILHHSELDESNCVKLYFHKTDGSGAFVQADIVIDKSKSVNLISYCDGKEAEYIPQFSVNNLAIFE